MELNVALTLKGSELTNEIGTKWKGKLYFFKKTRLKISDERNKYSIQDSK